MRDVAKVIAERAFGWALWLVVLSASVMPPAQAQSSFKSRRDFRVGEDRGRPLTDAKIAA